MSCLRVSSLDWIEGFMGDWGPLGGLFGKADSESIGASFGGRGL